MDTFILGYTKKSPEDYSLTPNCSVQIDKMIFSSNKALRSLT